MERKIPELDQKGLRNFSWMFAAVVAILFGLLLPWLLNRDWPLTPWVIAMIFFVWGLLVPKTLRPFYRLWMRFGMVMNAIVTRITLGAVFYGVILPFGLVFRLRGKDLLKKKWDHHLSSYRVESQRVNQKHMDKPF